MKRFFIIFMAIALAGVGNITFAKDNSKIPLDDEVSQQARAFYAQNNIDEALDLLTQKKESERSAHDWLLIGNIMQDKNKLPEAMYMFNHAIIADEKFYKAHYNLGYIYLSQDKPNMALSEFKKAVKYKPDFAYGYYNIGCAYLKLKNYRTAKFNFFKALDLKANEPNIYYNLAYSYKMLGNEKKAKTYLDLYNKIMESNEL